MKKKIIAGMLSALLLTTTSISVFAEGVENFNWNNAPQTFTDVPSHQWYYNDVSKASASGIINGIGNNQFNPNGTLTHAEAMTLMAKVHAIYHYGNPDAINGYTATSDHWASGIYAYCQEHSLPTPSESNFDTNITRGTMARYFRQALPSIAFEEINDFDLAPEKPNNSMVEDLFKAGIMIGDNYGFRLEDSITRAEAAAIIHRVANPDVRVEVEAKAPETPVTPPAKDPSYQGGGTIVTPGQVQTDKPYTRIPHTNWQSDPTGGVTITSQSGAINTKYGNHTYGCNNQQEYDKVMSVIGEAYNYASQKESTRVYRGGDIKKFYVKGSFLKFYRDEVGLSNENDMMSMGITEDFVYNMYDYLYDTYAKPNGNGINTDSQNNNVYKWLFGGGHLDCDGRARLYMLCYDYLGFSTRMVGSYKIQHACGQVYVNGQWVLINQLDGKLDDVTHSQLMELISGIKNEHYDCSQTDDSLIKNAAQSLKTGDTSFMPDDIAIRDSATHNPSDTSIR